VVSLRLARSRIPVTEVRCDVIGIDALHGGRLAALTCHPYEVRLRVAARTNSLAAAQAVANEVESLYTNGPAGGGGATKSTREVLSLASTLIPRELVRCDVQMEVA
jgi:hypothetical protein